MTHFIKNSSLKNTHSTEEKKLRYEKKNSSSEENSIVSLHQHPKGNQADDFFDPTQEKAPLIIEQIIRPTGLLDPIITLRPLKRQIDETIELAQARVARQERVLITTLTKRTAEDLSHYLKKIGLKSTYLHSDIDTIERVEILRSLRNGEIDILIGINLLREGLDLPEVSLVCILDADKEGFLRSKTSLIQTAGRAARHERGEVILFADTITKSIKELLFISQDRRTRQMAYNKAHGITPRSVIRPLEASLKTPTPTPASEQGAFTEKNLSSEKLLAELTLQMKEASLALEYEKAALLRDQIKILKEQR